MRYNFSFDIVKHSRKFFILSIAITVIGIVALATMGFHLGVDFKSGTTLDIFVGQPIDKAKAEQLFTDAGFSPASVTIGGTNQDRVTVRFDKVLEQDEVNKVMSGYIAAFGDQVSKEENTVDTALAKELARNAIIGVLIASIGVCLYICIRFEWRFAISAIVALLHDAFIVISLFSIFRLEVNLPFVAAVLTIIGYSINDTIVIFDRIRENMRFAKIKSHEDLADLVNRSIWQTMTRSINTVVTVLIAAVCLMILGSEAIRLFSLAIVFGLISGAYSSIFIASPLWLMLKKPTFGKARKVSPAK